MKVGSLFSGYGGLDLAVGGELAWYAEVEPAACRVLEAHHPNVPNIGDVTQYGDCTCGEVIPWDHLPPVDVITAGYPCQPFSTAGQRKGTEDERHLWPYVRDALSGIRPQYGLLENVRGHLTMGLDIVLADLAGLGYNTRWGIVRASDAGAPHRRERLFVVASDAARVGKQEPQGDDLPVGGLEEAVSERSRSSITDTDGEPERHAAHRERVPRPRDRTRGARATGSATLTRPSDPLPTDEERACFGPYAQAVARWRVCLGREAPEPMHSGRLSSRFVEWMMGLPVGWVTGHGLTLPQELKMLGNGVVPQQARLALDLLGGPR